MLIFMQQQPSLLILAEIICHKAFQKKREDHSYFLSDMIAVNSTYFYF